MRKLKEICTVISMLVEGAQGQDLVLLCGAVNAHLSMVLGAFAKQDSQQTLLPIKLIPLNYRDYRLNKEGGVVMCIMPDREIGTVTQQINTSYNLTKILHVAKSVKILVQISGNDCIDNGARLIKELRYLADILPSIETHLERVGLVMVSLESVSDDLISAFSKIKNQLEANDTTLIKLMDQLICILENEPNKLLIIGQGDNNPAQLLRKLDRLEAIRYTAEEFKFHLSFVCHNFIHQQLDSCIEIIKHSVNIATVDDLVTQLNCLKLLNDQLGFSYIQAAYDKCLFEVGETLVEQFNARVVKFDELLELDGVTSQAVSEVYNQLLNDAWSVREVLRPYLKSDTLGRLEVHCIASRYEGLFAQFDISLSLAETSLVVNKLKLLSGVSSQFQAGYTKLRNSIVDYIQALVAAVEKNLHAEKWQAACCSLEKLETLAIRYGQLIDYPLIETQVVDLKSTIRLLYAKQNFALLSLLRQADLVKIMPAVSMFNQHYMEMMTDKALQKYLSLDDVRLCKAKLSDVLYGRYEYIKADIMQLLTMKNSPYLESLREKLLDLKQFYQLIDHTEANEVDYQLFLKQVAIKLDAAKQEQSLVKNSAIDVLVEMANVLEYSLRHQSAISLVEVAQWIALCQKENGVLIADFAAQFNLEITDKILESLRSLQFAHALHAHSLLKKLVFLDRYLDMGLFAKTNTEYFSKILTALQDHKKHIQCCIMDGNCVELEHLLSCYSFSGDFDKELFYIAQAQIIKKITDKIASVTADCDDILNVPQFISHREMIKLLFDKFKCVLTLESLFINYYPQFDQQMMANSQVISKLASRIVDCHLTVRNQFLVCIGNQQYYHAYLLASRANYFRTVFERIDGVQFSELAVCDNDDIIKAIGAALYHYRHMALPEYFEDNPTALYHDLQKLSEVDAQYYAFYKKIKSIIIKAYEAALASISTLQVDSQKKVRIYCVHALELLPAELKSCLEIKFELMNQSTAINAHAQNGSQLGNSISSIWAGKNLAPLCAIRSQQGECASTDTAGLGAARSLNYDGV